MSDIHAKQVDYHMSSKPSPQYKFLRIPLNNQNTSTITINDTQQQLEFKLPSTSVYNLARSHIGYNLNIPAGGGLKYNHTFEDVFSLGSDIFFGTAGGIDLCNLKFANNYTKIATKMNTKVNEFLSNDVANQLYPCNTPAAYLPVNQVNAGNLNPPYHANHEIGYTNYIEPRYMATGVVGLAFERNISYPLKHFSNTIFSYDKDLYFGNEMYIRTMTSPLNKIAWRTRVAVAADPIIPTRGVEPLIPAATLNNVYLWLAVEQNDQLSDSVKAKFNAGGFKVNIPYTVGFTNSSSSSVANVNVQITKQYGKRLLQILHSAFDSANTANIAYDCDNREGIKIESYRTQLDSKYLQDYELSCKGPAAGIMNNDDWFLANQKFCKDNVILNKHVYGYNWFHCDRFYEENEVQEDTDNLSLGMPLTANTINWTFNSNVANNGLGVPVQLTHHTWLTFRRGYTINKDGVTPDMD